MISIHDSRQLKAASLALKGMDRELRNAINRETTKTFGPVWKAMVAQEAKTATDRAVFTKGTRLAGGNPPTLFAANSKRKMRGGLIPAEKASAFEFGSPSRQNKRTYTGRSELGKSYTVKRRTHKAVPPSFPKGRVVYPAFAKVAPRIASLWVQLVVKRTFDAMEGK